MNKRSIVSLKSVVKSLLCKLFAFLSLVILVVPQVQSASVTWTGATNNDWDVSTDNWSGVFTNGDDATFDLTAGGTINLVDVIAPTSTTVSAASGTFTFQGTGITTGTLNKSGGGTLVLNNNGNVYDGATTIDGGTLQLQAATPVLPSSISGLVVHLDANDVNNTGTNPPDGTVVTTWVNKVAPGSGGVGDFPLSRGAGAILGTSGAQTSNGLSLVNFDRSTILCNPTNFGNNVTILYIGRMNGGANERLVSAVANNWLLGYWRNNQNVHFWDGSPNLLAGALDYNSHIFVGSSDGTNATLFNADGQEFQVHTAPVNSGPNGLCLGGTDAFMNGEQSFGSIGELLVFDRPLTPTERLQMEQYLQSRWVGVLPGATVVDLTTSGAALELNDVNQTIGTLAGVAGTTVDLSDKSLTTGGNDLDPLGSDDSNTTFSGVLTGNGGSFTKYGEGTMTLDGSVSNTHTGVTTAQNGTLILAKTEGAKAIGGDLTFLNGPSPDVFLYEDEQFVPGTVISFESNSGDHGRLDLYGTTQTVAGIQTLYTATRGVIQNREFGPINEDDSTLVLDGSADYYFNGNLRNGFGSQFGTLSLTKNGSGTQTLAGNIIYTGPTALNAGTIDRNNAPGYASPTTIASGATMIVTNPGNFQGSTGASVVLNDGSTLVHNGVNAAAQYWVLNAPVTVSSGAQVTLNQTSLENTAGVNKGAFLDQGLKGGGGGSIVTINADNPGNGFTFRNNNTNYAGKLIINGIADKTVNLGSGAAVGGCTVGLTNADIEINGTMELLAQGLGWAGTASGDFWMGALDGSGVMVGNHTSGGTTRVRIGNTGVDGTFSGEIADGTGNVVVLTKWGAGTQTFTGTNTYTGNTNVNEGNMVLDFDAGPVSDILSTDSMLVLGGGDVEIKGGSGEFNTQAFDGIVAAANGTLQLTLNGANSVDAIVGNIGFGGGSINFAGADTTMAGVGNATRGSTNFITTTVTAGNDGSSRLGANLWNGTDWISTASDGVATTYIVPWQGTYTDIYNGTDSGSVAIPTGMPGAEVRILESTTNVNNTLGADETINSLLMDANTNAATIDMMGNTLTVGNGAAAFGSIGLTSSAQSLMIGVTADDGVVTAGATEPSAIGFVNENPASSLIVNSAIADNAGPAPVDPDPATPQPVFISVGGAAGSTVVFNGTNTYTGSTSIAAGMTLQIGGGGTLGSGTYAGGINNNGTLRHSSTTAQSISGSFTGDGGLIVDSSSGALTLSGGGINITGPTSVVSGTLNLATTTSWNSPVVVESGAVFEFGGTANAEHTPWTGDALTLNDGAVLNKTNTGFDTMNEGNLVINGTVSINITNNGVNNQLFVGGNASPTGLTGSGTINLTNTGTATTGMTLRYSSSQPHFDGILNVSGGVVNVGTGAGGQTLDNADVNLTAAKLNIGETAFAVAPAPGSVKSLSGDAASLATLGAQTLTVGTNDGNGSFAGVVSGTGGGIVKVGLGTQYLTGTNTYTGSTLVSGGTLGGTGSVDSAVTVSSGASLAPGTSVGTFTVSQSVDIESGGLLSIEVDGATADLLDVTGTLDVDGATIDFAVLNAPTEPMYVIASAASITGTPGFSNVPSGYIVSMSATEISLELPSSIYDVWAINTHSLSFGVNAGIVDDPETDMLVNLLEFAFGTDPQANDNASLIITDGSNFTPGTPIVRLIPPYVPTNVVAQFVRRKDAVAAGLTYVPEFSADLSTWETDPDDPAPAVVSTQVGDYEVVEVPYLVFLTSGQKAAFFRIRVNSTDSPVVTP